MADPAETQQRSGVGLVPETEVGRGTSGPVDRDRARNARTLSSPGLARTLAPGEAGPEPTDFPVARWDRYAFVRLLGTGGMGAVYEARDLRLDRPVALKFILGGDRRLTLRLLQEARAQARVEHENVCKVFEVGEVEGKAYIAMQLVDGCPLGEAARRMSLHQKVQAIRDVARALHEAHTLGILHRDIKPSNILVETCEDGRLRPIVMDFGIAREEGRERGLTETGTLLGTPAYMSPEQARGEAHGVDRRSDVYSLGATLHELLAGAPPFDGGTAVKTVIAVLYEEPPRLRDLVPSIPEDLDTIVAKCLRKEPGRRYDSAKALAEDLDRYNRGEPILGRKESLLGRLRRRAEKHRALVITAALALGAVAAAGGLGLRARVVARRQAAELAVQAELGRELGQDVKEMEWFLRAAHLLPLHDVTRERAVVKERMKRLDDRAVAGAAAAAQVDYAVGRGHLALGEDAEAATRLVRAERGGLDTPELHYALGLARGRLYHRAAIEARRAGDARSVERRLLALEEQYLKPALASMERSGAVRLEAPSYLPGLVAFYRKDDEGALRLAEKAHDEAPWLYEAIELQADVLLTRGIERKDRGERGAAAADLEQAARLYDAAAESGRSDASLYEGSAEAWVRRMEMEAGSVSPEDSLAHALERCNRAATARPDTSAPYTEMAYALDFMAIDLQRRGADPRPLLERELSATDRALAIGEDDFAIHERRSGALSARGQYEMDHGLDPSASLDRAVLDARRAIELAPAHPWGHVALGVNFYLRALHTMGSGGDPEPDLRAAIDGFRRAYSIDEGYEYAYGDALQGYGSLAHWKATRGRDPSEEAAQAEGAFAGCVKANPNGANCYENQGIVEHGLAEYRVAAGGDAREPLSRALGHFEKARSLMPDVLENRQYLAWVGLLRAEDALRRGEDPAPSLDAAGRALAEGYQLDAKDPVCTRLDARRALLAAGAPPARREAERQAGWEQARALGLLAVERNPHDADALQVLAEAEHRLADGAAAPADRARHRAAGLDACTRGLAQNPNQPRLHATRGALLVLEARAAKDPAARAASARQAREALGRAVELSPLLRGEAAPLLAEAERLGG